MQETTWLKYCTPPVLQKPSKLHKENDYGTSGAGFTTPLESRKDDQEDDQLKVAQPRNRLEKLAAAEYLLTPVIFLLVILYVWLTKKDFNTVQHEITVTVGIAATIRTTLLARRVSGQKSIPQRRNNEIH